MAAGAPVRTITELADQLPTLADRDPLRVGPGTHRSQGLGRGDATLRRRLPTIRGARPPPTLVHGDFHPWNVARRTRSRPRDLRLVGRRGKPPVHRPRGLPHSDPRQGPAPGDARHVPRALGGRRDPGGGARGGGEPGLRRRVALPGGGLRPAARGLEPEDRGGMVGATGSWARGALDALERGIDTERPGHADG